MKRLGILLSISVLVMVFSISADAASRTFIASTGADAGTCPRATPCAGLAYALTQTDPGGTVVILDTTAIGGASIATSVTIAAAPGAQGLIKVQPSTAGITVTAGTVILEGLRIEGFGGGSTTGVNQTGGKTVIRNCYFSGLTTGLSVTNTKSDVDSSNFDGNGTAVRATGTGVNTGVFPLTGTTQLRLRGGSITNNTTALSSVDPGVNLFNILVWIHGNSSADFPIYFAGNTNLTSCSGTGSPCFPPGTFGSTSNPN